MIIKKQGVRTNSALLIILEKIKLLSLPEKRVLLLRLTQRKKGSVF